MEMRETALQPVWNNLLKRLDGVSREYDGFGRMTVRHDTHRRVTQRFSYDDEHRISRVEIDGDAEFTKAEYRYDALGRRTEKQVWRRHARKPERTQYAWSGLQMVGETSDSHPDAAVQYIYTENSYEPLARVDSHGEHTDIFWYHTELNGLPDSVTDSNGDTVWRGASSAWGRRLRESTPVEWDTPQNLRFQGQYLDRETGLHYNTFRYYDPAAGCYTQMDPIGLLGGINLYQYVSNPLNWMDPVGLSGCAIARASDYRHTLGGKPGRIGKGRNIATSNYHIDGITGTVDAVSGKGSIPGFVDIPDLNNRLFTTTVVSHPRAFDSEAKILEHIGSKITPDAKGTIDLFSGLPICKSCRGVIQQFESKYPGVKINIL